MKREQLKDVTSVLVLGAENRIVLTIIRALGKILPQAELHVLSPYSQKKPIWNLSKYVTCCHKLRSSESAEVADELIVKIKETDAQIIIPVDEIFVRHISVLEKKLKGMVYLPPLPTPEQFDQLVPKDRLNQFLIDHQMPYATNYRMDDPALTDLNDDIFPLILKPMRSSSGFGMEFIKTRERLKQVRDSFHTDHYLLQEYIPGNNLGISLLAINGKIKAYTIQKSLQDNGFMFSTAIQFVHNHTVYKTAKQVIASSNYSGLANMDFRIDDRNGKARLIDFNARFWVSVLGSKAAGIDFVRLYCLAALGQKLSVSKYEICTYLMGMHSVKYYFNRMLNKAYFGQNQLTFTDLWDRLNDPKPELFRYVRRLQKK